jgi:serine/threonine protein kinase
MLGDFGETCHVTSEYAKTGTQVGAPMWTSPEVLMEAPWDTSTDIWSFGIMVSLPTLPRMYRY